MKGVDGNGDPTLWPLGGWWEHSDHNPFRLQNGKVPAEVLTVNHIGYQPYMPASVPGLKGVLLVVRKNGVEILREESPNGVWDKTCTLYPGNGAHYGPDVLQLKTEYVVPEKRESGVEGEITLYLTTDKSVWAKYDLETGTKLASSEPEPSAPAVPLTLAISLVQLDETGRIALLSKKSLRWGLKLSVRGSRGKSATVEYADAIGGKWTALTKLDLTYGSGEFVEPLPPAPTRFYRVR